MEEWIKEIRFSEEEESYIFKNFDKKKVILTISLESIDNIKEKLPDFFPT